MFSWIWRWLFPFSEVSFSLDSLPNDVLYELLLYIDLKGLYNLSRVNRRLNLFLSSEFFWRNKCFHDFGKDEPIGTWKETYIKRTFNKVFVFGANECGQLGLGDTEERRTPVELPLPFKVKAIAAGDHHTLILDNHGTVYTFGRNDRGQLGIGKIDEEPHPKPYALPDIRAKAVFAGTHQSFFIDSDNNVWAFGNDRDGQLGLGIGGYVHTPTQIHNFKAKYISSGGAHTLFIDLEDSIWVTGVNQTDGLFKLRNIKAKSEGVIAGVFMSYIIDSSGKVWTLRTRNLGITLEPSPDLEAKFISSGLLYTIITEVNGKIHLFTPDILRNFFSLSGPIEVPKFKAVRTATGECHCLAIDPDRSVWVFGHGTYGELGLGERNFQGRPKRLPGLKAINVSTMNNHSVILGKRVEERRIVFSFV